MIISNLTAVKIIDIGGLILIPGVFIFPLSIMFGDVLTEVYGFKNARKVILLGFLVLLIMIVFMQITLLLPYPDFWTHQEAVSYVFSTTPRIFLASATAYLIGSLTNAWILVRIGRITKGKFLWMRTIGSTIIGQAIDTSLFITIAFLGAMPTEALLAMMLNQYLIKLAVQAFCGTPLAYKFVRWARQ